MRAMILAAGYSTRLWPLTIDRAKPAIPFLNRPLVGYVAEYLSRYGYSEVLINLHHQPQSVRAALGDGSRFGVKLHYIEEPEILGTSGAWDNARSLLEDETFLAINGKIITDLDLDAALETHRRLNALATLVLKKNSRREKFSIVETRDELITGFGGMPPPVPASDKAGDEPLMFTGIQILNPRIFQYIPRGVFSHSTTDVYPQAIAAGERIVAHVADGNWYELSTIPRYLDIHLQLLGRENLDTIAGRETDVSTSAVVSDAVLWERVIVQDGARVHRAVLGDGVMIKSGEVIEDAAVVRAELVSGQTPPVKALTGRFSGDNFIVPFAQ